MTKDEVYKIVKENIMEILPDIIDEDIKLEISLKNLGANSIDRMDIVVMSMEALNIRAPLVEFGKLNNIQGLVDLLFEYKSLKA